MTARRLLALLGAVTLLLGVACSSVPNVSPLAAKAPAGTTAPAAPPAPKASQPVAREAAADSAAALNVNVGAAEAQSQAFDRMVIRTAQIGLEVSDIDATLTQIRQIAAQGGGIVSASNTRVERVDNQERTVADLTIQVRTEGTDAVLSALRGLGKVTTETSASQDVTEEYVDLESNLRNLQASESAILRLMDRAQRIEDVVALQRELTTIRGQIERIQGRKRYLERRTDMATIAISLRLPVAENARPIGGGAWDPFALAARGWQASLTVLRAAAEIVILVLSFSWWLIPLAIGAAYVWQQRRRPRTNPTPTPDAA